MRNYVIHGAGAVGSAIGGSLARAGLEVTLVSRRPHVNAVRSNGGLVLKTLTGTLLQPVKAVEHISETTFSPDTVIFQTMKANDTRASLEDLGQLDHETPIVCWQNGVDNESVVSKVSNRVFGGVVRFTATMMTPGETQFAGTGKFILGRYPEGEDPLAHQIAQDLRSTGFEAIVSSNIMQDKWLKLLVNLISCVKPMTKKTNDEPRYRREICRHLLEEGIGVLDRAGIRAESTNGTEDSAEKMLSNFVDALNLAEGKGQGMVLQNSTWQSLARRRKSLENDLYTGLIVELGEEHGVPTPYNKAVLSHLHTIAEGQLGPEAIDAQDIIRTAEGLSYNHQGA